MYSSKKKKNSQSFTFDNSLFPSLSKIKTAFTVYRDGSWEYIITSLVSEVSASTVQQQQ